MFARSNRGVIDFCAAALCLWAAVYHTPAGALVRSAVALATKSSGRPRPLLAYYTGGVYDAHEVHVPPSGFESPLLNELALPGAAMGRGVWVTVERLGPKAQALAETLARRYRLPAVSSPSTAAELLGRLKGELPTDDAAVLAVFAGFDVARYATERVRAEGRPSRLESLARHLPPSRIQAVRAASAALTLGTAYALAWPVPANTKVTSPFGHRRHPITFEEQLHSGVDLGLPVGTPVRVTADGIVRRASEDNVNGRMVTVDHGHGIVTAYCHNSSVLVGVGARVSAGEVISTSGNTGRSTGPHLHYQLNVASKPTDPFVFRDTRARTQAQQP